MAIWVCGVVSSVLRATWSRIDVCGGASTKPRWRSVNTLGLRKGRHRRTRNPSRVVHAPAYVLSYSTTAHAFCRTNAVHAVQVIEERLTMETTGTIWCHDGDTMPAVQPLW